MRTVTKIGIIIIVILIVLMGAFYIYTLDYYRADEKILSVLNSDGPSIERTGRLTIIKPNDENDRHTGLVFYPGGKVEAIAYTPLLEKLADRGITCVLVKMPFNLAVFDINAIDKVFDNFSGITDWYLAGHSLGGAMSSSYVNENSDHLAGLILLGAYPLNDEDIHTLVIYGTEDHGIDPSKLEYAHNIFEIVGGNHAYFGNYGEQKGDGRASISRQEQQDITVSKIMAFINEEQ